MVNAKHKDKKKNIGQDLLLGDVYSVREVARIFNIGESKLRYWAQTGFLNPSVKKGARIYYTFSDLIGVKTAQDLLDKGLSLQKVRKNLSFLRSLLPEEKRPLSRLRIRSDGEQLVILGEEAVYEVETHQMLLDFRTESLQENVDNFLENGKPAKKGPTLVQSKTTKRTPEASAYSWFLKGLASSEKEEKKREAESAFRKALELDPSLASACTNLGNILYDSGRVSEARVQYERALALDPDQPEARYNLANIYEEEGRLELAIAEYMRVIAICPDFPDSYFNLGLALEKTNNYTRAGEYFRKYLALDPDSDGVWCRLARDHLLYLDNS